MKAPINHAPAKPEAQALHAAKLAALKASGRDLACMTAADIIAAFIDQPKIDAAVDLHRQAVARRAETDEALRTAMMDHEAVADRARRAIKGETQECPVACAKAEGEAKSVVAVREQVRNAAEDAVAAADRGIQEARAVAHRPALLETIRRRLAAVTKRDRAVAMLAEVEADWRLVGSMQAHLGTIGMPWPLGGMTDNTGMPIAPWSMQDELARWDGTPHRPRWWDNDVRAILAEAGE